MGIHVSVVSETGEEHPDWDGIRYMGDSDLPGIVADSGAEEIGCRWKVEPIVRPTNLDAFQKRLMSRARRDYPKPDDFTFVAKRRQELCALLRDNPTFGIHFS